MTRQAPLCENDRMAKSATATVQTPPENTEILDAIEGKPAPAAPRPTVTPAAVWRRKATARWFITLPSSTADAPTVVKVRRLDAGRLVQDNIIQVEELLRITAEPDDKEGHESRYAFLIRVANAIIPHVVVEPRVVAAANGHASDMSAEEAISVDEILESDRLAILFWMFGLNQIQAVEAPDPGH